MNREIHVRFCEGVRVRLPCATRLSGYSALDCMWVCDPPPLNIVFKSNGCCLGAMPAGSRHTFKPTVNKK